VYERAAWSPFGHQPGQATPVQARISDMQKGDTMASPFQTHGAFSWMELMTTDPKAAEQFYSQLLGWELEPNAMGHAGYTAVKAGGQGIGGIMRMPKEVPAGTPPHWTGYVTVADVDATVRKAQALGGTVCHPPMDIERVGRFAVLRDPQGAVFSVIQYKMSA
jgi:predicted enzyme related to lactoylglutathione lyase